MQSAVNERLTRVGPGTPMGNLLRRYWHPVAAVAELEDRSIKPIRLLGENLVLYKDIGGSYGLIDRKCPHRRADLCYGFVEQRGIRCSYHGWRFDETGRCIEQPFEETALPASTSKDRIRVAAYPVEAKAGLLWAYLGAKPPPLVPTWEPFTWANGFVQIVFSEVPCNWLQCQENSIDPVHFEWLHDTWAKRMNDRPGPAPAKHLKIDFEEFDWGIAYKRIREGQSENDELWTVGRVCLWPHALFTGGHFEWRVPMDDTNTLSVGWFFDRVPKEREPFAQERIPYWYSPVTDPNTGCVITSHIMNQDFVGWVGQGAIADRENEHLGASDRGIVMMRRRLLSDIEVVAAGGEPKAIVRDPAQNQCIRLPIINRRLFVDGLTRAERDAFERKRRSGSAAYNDGFVYLSGQPEEIRKAFEAAMR
jgi:5,5'-dehydrodivanillate O-demethylase